MSWKELSDTTKALIYLVGLIASAFVGGVVVSEKFSSVSELPRQVTEIESEIDNLLGRVGELEEMIAGVVRFNDDIALRSYVSKSHALGVSGSVDVGSGSGLRGGSIALVEDMASPSRQQMWTIRRAQEGY